MAGALKGYRHYSKEDAEGHWFFLSFKDKDLEALYERYTFPRLKKRMRDANIAQIVCGLLLASAEAVYHFAGDATYLTLALRLVAILPAVVMWAVQSQIHKRWVMEFIFVLATSLSGILIAVGNGVGIREGQWDLFGPFRWWSAANEMFFIALLLISALRFPQVVQIALCQPLFTCFNYIWMPPGTPSYQGMVLAVYIASLLGVLMMCYRREVLERREFVSLVNLFADKKRREELLDEMLPRRVRDALTQGNAPPGVAAPPAGAHGAAPAAPPGVMSDNPRGSASGGPVPTTAPQTPGANRAPRPSNTGSESGQIMSGALSTSSSVTGGNDASAPGSPDGRRQSRLSADLMVQRSARPSATPGFPMLPPTAEGGSAISGAAGLTSPVPNTAPVPAPAAAPDTGMRAIKFEKRKKGGNKNNEDDDDAPKAVIKRPCPKLLFWDEATQSWIPPNYKFGAALGTAAVKAVRATNEDAKVEDIKADAKPPMMVSLLGAGAPAPAAASAAASKKDVTKEADSSPSKNPNASMSMSSVTSRSAPGDASNHQGDNGGTASNGNSIIFRRRGSNEGLDGAGGRRGSSLGREKASFRAEEFPGVSAMVAITQRRASQQGLAAQGSPAMAGQGGSLLRVGSRKGSLTDSILQSAGSFLSLGGGAEGGASSANSAGGVANSSQQGMRRTSGFSSFVAERRASTTITMLQEELQSSSGPVAVPGLLLSPGGSGLPPLGSSRRLVSTAATTTGNGPIDTVVLPGTPTSSTGPSSAASTARALFSSSDSAGAQPAGGTSSSLPGNPSAVSPSGSPDRRLAASPTSPDGGKTVKKVKSSKSKRGEGLIYSPTKSLKKVKTSSELEQARSARKNPANVTPLVDPLHDETDLLSFIEDDLTKNGGADAASAAVRSPASGKDLLQLTRIPTAAVNQAGQVIIPGGSNSQVASSPVPGFKASKGTRKGENDSDSDDDVGSPVIKVNVDAIVKDVVSTARRASANVSTAGSSSSSSSGPAPAPAAEEPQPARKKAPPPPPRPSMRFNKTEGIVSMIPLEQIHGSNENSAANSARNSGNAAAFTGIDASSVSAATATRRVSQAHAPAGRRNSTGARRASLVAAMDMAAAAEAAAADEEAAKKEKESKEEMPKIPWGLNDDDLGLDDEHDVPLPDDGDLSGLPQDEVKRPANKARSIMKDAGLLTPGSKFAPKLGLSVKSRKLTAGSAIMSVSRMKGSLSSMVSRAKPGSRGSMTVDSARGPALHRNSTQGLASVDEERMTTEDGGAASLRRASSRGGDMGDGGASSRRGSGGEGIDSARGGDGSGDGKGDNSETVDTADSDELQEAIAHAFPNVTVMFVYIANLSELSGIAEPTDLIAMLNRIYLAYDDIVERVGVYKVMAIANMYLVVCGAHDDNPRHSETMALAACEIMKYVIRSRHELKLNGMAVDVQIGINNGEVAAGVIGTKAYHWHVFGDTVNVASRMCSSSEPRKIQISKRTAAEIRNVPESAAKFIITDRGTVTVKGKGSMETAWICDAELQGLYKALEEEKAAQEAAIAAGLLKPDGSPLDHDAHSFSHSPGGFGDSELRGFSATSSDIGTASRKSLFGGGDGGKRVTSRKSMLPAGFRISSGPMPPPRPGIAPPPRAAIPAAPSPVRKPMPPALMAMTPPSPVAGGSSTDAFAATGISGSPGSGAIVPSSAAAAAFAGGEGGFLAKLKRERQLREEALVQRAKALDDLNETAVAGSAINILTCEFVDPLVEKRFENKVRRELLQSTQRALLLATLIAPLTAIPQNGAGYRHVGNTGLPASSFFAIILTAICLACLLSITLDFPWAWFRACSRAREARKAQQAAWNNMMSDRGLPPIDESSPEGVRKASPDSGHHRGCFKRFWHLIRLQQHDFLAIIVAISFFILMNLAAVPAYGNGEISYLSTVNFTLFVSFSVLEIRAHILLATKIALFLLFTILMLIYVRGTALAEGLYAQIIIPFLGLMVGHFAAALREVARRKSYLVTHYAHKQKAKCEKLLINMLPSQWHVERMMSGQDIIETLEDVTLLYSDIKGFTELSSKLSAEALIKFLDALYSAFDQHLDYFGLTKVDTIGDAFIVCGAPNLKDRNRGGESSNGGNGGGEITFGSKDNKTTGDREEHDDRSGVVGVKHLVHGLSRAGRGITKAAGTLLLRDRSSMRRGSDVSTASGIDEDGMSIASPRDPLSPVDDDAVVGENLARVKGLKSEPTRSQLFGGSSSPGRSPGRSPSPGGIRRGNSFISRKRIAGWLSNQQQQTGSNGSSLLKFGKDGRGQPPPMMVAVDEGSHYDSPSSPGRSPPPLTPQGSFQKKGGLKRATAPGSFVGSGTGLDSTASSARVAPEGSPGFGDSRDGSGRHSYASSGAGTASRADVSIDTNRSDDAGRNGLRTKPSKGILKPQGSATNLYPNESPNSSPRHSANAHVPSYPASPTGAVPNLRLPENVGAGAAASSRGGPPALAQVDVVSQPLAAEERTSLSHCGAVALFAMDMLQEIARIRENSRMPVELRIGLHSGRVVGGIIGKSRPRYFIWGNDTVIANLMESSGIPGQIQVSEPTGARLRKEGFILEAYQTVNTEQGGHGHGPADGHAAPHNKEKDLQCYLLRAYVAPDKTIISVPEPPKKGH